MRIAGIVEGWITVDHETERTTNHAHTADDRVKSVSTSSFPDRHVVRDFTYTVRRKQSRDENVCRRPIELLYLDLSNGSNLKKTSPLIIENPSEYTGRVEMGKTKPIDRSVHPNQSDGVHVADDPVVLDRL